MAYDRSSTPLPSGWQEIGDRIWTRADPWLDVNVSVIAGERGLAVVDTLGSGARARVLAADVRALGAHLYGTDDQVTVLAVVNTHWHFDHTFGNTVLVEAWPEAELVAHEDAAAELAASGETARVARSRPGHPESQGHEDDVAATTLTIPTRTFSAAHVLDLGGRRVELLHLGAGHTAGDAVVLVPDADVVLAGDLVEQAGPPFWGEDSHPLEWPRTLDVLLGLVGPGTTVVPGHGRPVGRAFVEEQRGLLGQVAETIRHLASTGVPVSRALAEGNWPLAPELLEEAVRRGYAQLPRADRRLPLV